MEAGSILPPPRDKIDLYYEQILRAKSDIQENITLLCDLLKEKMNSNTTIFITGIGKSYHVAKKCVATWQSLQLNVHNLLVQDLFHGDMGIIKENDIVIYMSNSGNTKELIEVSEYLKQNKNVFQIGIVNNRSCELEKSVDMCMNICNFKIKEADSFEIVPSVSSVMFMMFCDLIGIKMSEMKSLTREDFKKNHPVGIGKLL
jgi:arabinose-5-phosphate isomerase